MRQEAGEEVKRVHQAASRSQAIIAAFACLYSSEMLKFLSVSVEI